MSARRRAPVVQIPRPAPVAMPLESMLMEEPEGGLRVLLLALHGLKSQGTVNGLSGEDARRELGPLIALSYDIQASLERERARASATVGTGGEEA